MGWLPTVPHRRVFVSWWKYTSRPDSFARAVNAENYFFAQGANLWHFKYLPRAIATFSLLLRRRPGLVFASNPPPLCPLVVWVYCRLFNACYCLDSHTSAFDRRRWLALRPLHLFLARRAIWEATTNDELTNRQRAEGSQAVTVPDIPFELPHGAYPIDNNGFTVAFVCSFDVDEPIATFLDAARQSPEVQFYVTGNPAKASKVIHDSKPGNVTFTGFLSNDQYAGLVRNVDCIMVLTTFDHTMQRGGSEAVSVEKPLITSDFPILRKVFDKGTVHVDNSVESIRKAVETVKLQADKLQEEMRQLKLERSQRWDALREELERRIDVATARTKASSQ